MKLQFGGRSIETSNDDKLLFPDAGLTKADVIGYYRDVADLMIPHLRHRCLTIQRFPDGLSGDGFYQQNRSAYFPGFIRSRPLPKAGGDETIDHIVIDDALGLVYLADQAAISFHGWLALVDAPRRPDRVVFDLDPADDDFESVVFCARELRKALDIVGLVPYVMTTGSRGLHVVAPLDRSLSFDEVRPFAKDVAAAVADEHPSKLTVEQRKRARKGRLYVDISRNAYGQTAVLPYSLRARDDAPAATPLDWDELGRKEFSPRRYGLSNMRRRLAQKSDPFADFHRHRRKPSKDFTELARRRVKD